jgi:hypothetical protein
MRASFGICLLALIAACQGPGNTVAWTIDGQPAATACAQATNPTIQLTVRSTDTGDRRRGNVATTTTVAPCADGEANDLSIGRFAEVTVDLLDGETVVGSALPVELSQNVGTATANVTVDRSTIAVELTAVGQSCGDAGVAAFTLTVTENIEPLNNVIVVEDANVPCTGGKASYEVPNTRVGASYSFIATAPGYATRAQGEGVVAAGLRTGAVVDLSAVAAE